MERETYSLSELAEAGGVSGRTVRYYVQEGLLPPPAGLGRGSHYGAEHVGRLRRILELQRAGHSLMGIRAVLEGKRVPVVEAPPVRGELLTRVRLAEGVEVTFDAQRFSPSAAGLMELKEVAKRVFGL